MGYVAAASSEWEVAGRNDEAELWEIEEVIAVRSGGAIEATASGAARQPHSLCCAPIELEQERMKLERQIRLVRHDHRLPALLGLETEPSRNLPMVASFPRGLLSVPSFARSNPAAAPSTYAARLSGAASDGDIGSISVTLALSCLLLCVPGALAYAHAPDAEPAAPPQHSASTQAAAPAEQPATAVPAGRPADVQAAYRVIVTHAVSEFDAGHFAEARSLFVRAHELWPSARTLRTLGMTSFELLMYPRALEELQAALDDSRRTLPQDQRAQVLSLIEQTRAFVGRYSLRLSPAEAKLLVDGAPHPPSAGVLVLAVGDHTLLARAPGFSELRLTLVVHGREDEELALSLEPVEVSTQTTPAPDARGAMRPPQDPRPAVALESPGPNRSLPLSVLGAGAAGFIASGIFTGLTLSDKSTLASKCPNRECPPEYHSERDEMNRFADFATVGFVIGVVGAAVGSYLWFSGQPPRSESDHAASSEPWIGLGSTGVAKKF